MHLGKMQSFHILFAGGFIACARHNANNRERRRILVQGLIVVQMLADRIDIREVTLGKPIVDDDGARTTGHIFRSETPTAKNRHLQYPEIIRRNNVDLGGGLLTWLRFWQSGYIE